VGHREQSFPVQPSKTFAAYASDLACWNGFVVERARARDPAVLVDQEGGRGCGDAVRLGNLALDLQRDVSCG